MPLGPPPPPPLGPPPPWPARLPPATPANFVVPNPHVRLRRKLKLIWPGPFPSLRGTIVSPTSGFVSSSPYGDETIPSPAAPAIPGRAVASPVTGLMVPMVILNGDPERAVMNGASRNPL